MYIFVYSSPTNLNSVILKKSTRLKNLQSVVKILTKVQLAQSLLTRNSAAISLMWSTQTTVFLQHTLVFKQLKDLPVKCLWNAASDMIYIKYIFGATHA